MKNLIVDKERQSSSILFTFPTCIISYFHNPNTFMSTYLSFGPNVSIVSVIIFIREIENEKCISRKQFLNFCATFINVLHS